MVLDRLGISAANNTYPALGEQEKYACDRRSMTGRGGSEVRNIPFGYLWRFQSRTFWAILTSTPLKVNPERMR